MTTSANSVLSAINYDTQASTSGNTTNYYDSSGALTQSITEYSDGTSLNVVYDPDNSQVAQNYQTGANEVWTQQDTWYSGPNLSGTVTEQLNNFVSGTSQDEHFDWTNSDTWTDQIASFTGPNATGYETQRITDYRGGYSTLELFGYYGTYVERFIGPHGTGAKQSAYFVGNYAGGYYTGGFGFFGGYGYFGYDRVASRSIASSTSPIHNISAFDAVNTTPVGSTNTAGQETLPITPNDPAPYLPAFEGPSWASKVVTWSFAAPSDGKGTDPTISGTIDPQYRATIESAFQSWAAASGLTFVESTDPATADIQIGWGQFNTTSTTIIGQTNYSPSGDVMAPGVTIRLEDPSQLPLIAGSDGPTYDQSGATLYQVALHEIGRALGLGDNADPNSVMYFESTPNNQSLDLTDVTGAQALYGNSGSAASRGVPVADLAAADALLIQSIASIGQSSPVFGLHPPPSSTPTPPPSLAAAAELH